MSLFDYVLCRYPLPITSIRHYGKDVPITQRVFQTKDTPEQYMKLYIITEDGRLVHAPLLESDIPERAPLTGDLYFCTESDDGLIEFAAFFVDGFIKHFRVISLPGVPS